MKKLTVKELLDAKGRRRLTQVFCHTPEEARACEEAGIEMVVTIGGDILRQVRSAAPNVVITSGIPYGEVACAEEAVRKGFEILRGGADLVYACMSTEFIGAMAREGIPVVGHVGLVPQKSTWFGGFRAVGKTADQAMDVYRAARAHQEAGAVAVEMEVVPAPVAAAISRRLRILVISLGSGAACDVEYLYACDILGTRRNRVPRHSKTYCDLFTEMQRIQEMRVAAFKSYRAEVDSGAFPPAGKLVNLPEQELETFLSRMEQE